MGKRFMVQGKDNTNLKESPNPKLPFKLCCDGNKKASHLGLAVPNKTIELMHHVQMGLITKVCFLIVS